MRRGGWVSVAFALRGLVLLTREDAVYRLWAVTMADEGFREALDGVLRENRIDNFPRFSVRGMLVGDEPVPWGHEIGDRGVILFDSGTYSYKYQRSANSARMWLKCPPAEGSAKPRWVRYDLSILERDAEPV